MLWSLAWKNIWRNRTRSLIIACAIAVGLFGGLFSSAIYKAMADQRLEMAIRNETSNLQVHHNDFLENRELNDTISSLDSIISLLDTLPEINSFSARLKIVGIASSAANAGGVMISGINPEMEKKTTFIHACISDSMGSWFGNARRNFIVIGRKLADKLHLKLNSRMVLTFQDLQGNLIRAMYKVGGIYQTGNTSFDETNIFVRYDQLLPEAGFASQAAHEIAIALQDDVYNDSILMRLQAQFPSQEFQSWKTLQPDLGMMTDFMDATVFIMLLIILLALSFGIINTMLMAVMERTREFGMLMSLGMSKSKIFALILLETVFLSLTGAIAGMLLSLVSISLFGKHGIDLSSVAKGMEDIGFSAVIYTSLETRFYIGLTLLVILTGILSSIMPARRAVKLVPVEAIRVM
ncbi:MAG: FtsX-like permease family protein [Bacteroidales bacterium]